MGDRSDYHDIFYDPDIINSAAKQQEEIDLLRKLLNENTIVVNSDLYTSFSSKDDKVQDGVIQDVHSVLSDDEAAVNEFTITPNARKTVQKIYADVTQGRILIQMHIDTKNSKTGDYLQIFVSQNGPKGVYEADENGGYDNYICELQFASGAILSSQNNFYLQSTLDLSNSPDWVFTLYFNGQKYVGLY